MSYFDTEMYELSSDLEVDTLLAELPIELIKETIREQICDPLSTSVNYVNTITEKCEILKAEYSENEDSLKSINKVMRDFFTFIIDTIDEKYKLDIDVSEEDDETIATIGEALYNFLILRYKKNIGRFVYKYIRQNKKSLAEDFDKISKKKDVTSISLKKQMKNKDDITIISNLPKVISNIMNLDIEPLDFLKYACDEEYYEGSLMKRLILEGKIIGNFVEEYFRFMVDEHDEVMDEIQTEIKMKILKKIQ